MRDDHLVYEPLGLTVMPDSEKQEVLKRLYDDPVTGTGRGECTSSTASLVFNLMARAQQ